MDDLVKRLRELSETVKAVHLFDVRAVMDKAADRIEELNNIINRVLNDVKRSRFPDEMSFDWLDDARAALGEKKDG